MNNKHTVNSHIEKDSILGPLPVHWEKAIDRNSSKPYFVNNTTKTTSWIDPRTFHIRKRDLKDVVFGDLPYGWEEDVVGSDSYFIDHITQTHYWNPPWDPETRDDAIRRRREMGYVTERDSVRTEDSKVLGRVDALNMQRQALLDILGDRPEPLSISREASDKV